MLDLGPKYGVPACFLDTGPFKTKFAPEREHAWAEALKAERVDLVVLAGFMRVIKAPLLEAFSGRIINLHPSLLPTFPGLDGIGQAWAANVPEAGCTVHWVNAEIDGGAHLGQTRVRRTPDDTLESFANKIHAAEHTLLPAVIARLSESLAP
jgi:phosphoribosylglycinamide formyltransferase-1